MEDFCTRCATDLLKLKDLVASRDYSLDKLASVYIDSKKAVNCVSSDLRKGELVIGLEGSNRAVNSVRRGFNKDEIMSV